VKANGSTIELNATSGDITEVNTTLPLTGGATSGAITLDINDYSGCTDVTPGAKGAVPQPSAGDENDFLKGDGTWAPVVQSVATTWPLSTTGATGGVTLSAAVCAITPKAVSYPLLADYTDIGHTFINEGAGGAIEFTLPTAVAGYKYQFGVVVAQYLKITASAGDKIYFGSIASAAAGYIRSNSIGNTVTIISVDATNWLVTQATGTWTVDS
jgi:hypothetical protein